MVNGKKVLVFSPVNKGWGTATTALALCVMLEQEYKGKILLIDLFTELSSIEHYLEKDMGKQVEILPLEIFMESFDKSKLILFSRPISKSLYFIKVDCEKFKEEKVRRARIKKLIADSTDIFDVVVIRADGMFARDIGDWDAGISVCSFEKNFERTFANSSTFNWYREILKKDECLKVINGVPFEWGVKEALVDYIVQRKKAYFLPYNIELMQGANIGNRLYSYLREDMLANKSQYSKKVGMLADKVIEIIALKQAESGEKECIGAN